MKIKVNNNMKENYRIYMMNIKKVKKIMKKWFRKMTHKLNYMKI